MWLRLVFLMGIAFVPQADAVGNASNCDLDDLLDDIGDIVETEFQDATVVGVAATAKAVASMLQAGVSKFEDCVAYAKSFDELMGSVSTALGTAQTAIVDAVKSSNVDTFKKALKGLWDSFKDFVTSMIEAAKIRTRKFADVLESRMLLLTDPAETESYDKVFVGMSSHDISDLVNVLEDYTNEEVDDEDATAAGLWSIKLKVNAEASAGGSGRRLAAALTSAEQETVITASFEARASMEVESNARKYPGTHNVRRCKRRCNRRVDFRPRDLKAAKAACAEVTGDGGLLPANARGMSQMRAACASVASEAKCTPTTKRHFIRVMKYSMKKVVVVKQSRTVTSKKVIAGGSLDFDFKAGTTVVDAQMHLDMKAVIAKSLDVDAAWVYTKVAQVCRPVVVKRPAPKPRDGRRRAPKRGDGRRRRRSKKKKHRDARGCDGRRRAPPSCTCGCGCAARRRHKGKKHKKRKLRLLTEVDSDDLLGYDLIDSGDYWHVDNSSNVVAIEAAPEEFTPARRLDDDDDDKDRYKKHKRCKKCKRGKEPALTVVKQRCTQRKGLVGVKVFYDVRIPAYEEEVDVQVRSKVRMQTRFKNTVKKDYAACGCQSANKLNFKFEGKASAEFNYLERPRKARRSLTATLKGKVDMVSDAAWDMRTKFRANLRTKQKAITGGYADSKASFAASLKILTDRDDKVQCGCDKSNDVNFKIEAKGMAKFKLMKTKVDKGEDLTEEESTVMVKAAAMAHVEIEYKQKVEQDDNARESDKYYRLLLKGKAAFTDIATAAELKSDDFRDRSEKAFQQISVSMSATAKTTWESGMKKLAKGDNDKLTDEETKQIQISLKAGAEIEVARVDKERFDFALEVGGTIDVRGLSADQKEECGKAFEEAVSIYTGADCGNLRKTTIKCATGDKKKCWSVTTKYRMITDAMNKFCSTGCFKGEEQQPECSSTSALASKKCSCCDGESEMTVEDECEDVNEVWGLVAEGDFESFTEQQTKTFQKVLAEGKAWADKKYKAYRSSLAKKYSDCEDYLRNIVDWSEVSAAMRVDIKAAVASVKAKKSQVYYHLSEKEWALVDKAVEDIECTCKKDLPHEEKMVLRVTLDVAVRLEIAKTGEPASGEQQAELSDKTVMTKLKLKVKGAAAADLKTKEAKASIAGTFKAAFGAKSEHLVTVKDPTTLRRRLVDCETGRCLQETTVEIPVQQTIPKIEGDVDTMTEKNILTADKVALQESLRENMKAAGVKGEVTVDTVGDPETTECEADCVPKKQATLAGEPDLNVDTNVNGASRNAFSAIAAIALILGVAQ